MKKCGLSFVPRVLNLFIILVLVSSVLGTAVNFQTTAQAAQTTQTGPSAAPANGPTNVNGNIVSNTTWSLPGSPYIVTGNTYLYPDYYLTIEPGVEVRFNSGTQLQIRGELRAVGTSASPIIFTSNSPTPLKGDWGGIYIANNIGGKATIQYVRVSYAQTAISVTLGGTGPLPNADSSF